MDGKAVDGKAVDGKAVDAPRSRRNDSDGIGDSGGCGGEGDSDGDGDDNDPPGARLVLPCATSPYVYWSTDAALVSSEALVLQALGIVLGLAMVHSFPVAARPLHPYVWRRLHRPTDARPTLDDLALLRGERLVESILLALDAMRALGAWRAIDAFGADSVADGGADGGGAPSVPTRDDVSPEPDAGAQPSADVALLVSVLAPDSLLDVGLVSPEHDAHLRRMLARGVSCAAYAAALLPRGAERADGSGAGAPARAADDADAAIGAARAALLSAGTDEGACAWHEASAPGLRWEAVGMLLSHGLCNDGAEAAFDAFIGHWPSPHAALAGRDDSDGGFYRAVGGEWALACAPSELRALVCGPARLDVSEMRSAVTYGADNSGGRPYARWEATPIERAVVDLFWSAIALLEPAELRGLLWWWTGSDAPPLAGFGAMEHHWTDFYGVTGLQISVKSADHPAPDHMQAHTCFNQLELPRFAHAGRCAHLRTPRAVADYVGAVVRAAERAPLDFRDG